MAAFVPVLHKKLASAASETTAPYVKIISEIKKLEQSLIQIKGVLTDASQKEITDQSVKRWLNDLQHLAYDIDDALDDLATEARRHEAETNTSKVQNFSKINDITTKLQDLVEEKDALGLIVKEEDRSKDMDRRLETSMVYASSIVGRQAEKDALVHKLLGDESCDQKFSLVPIVGKGGVGKTTLARLLYDEQQVKDHFEVKAWVSVSNEFNSFDISKVIFYSVGGVNDDFPDLKLFQVALMDLLRDKRFLLVLDDVRSESCEDWETLVDPFHVCAHGSKIIMTTRNDRLLKMLGYSDPNQLGSLSHDDALSLVALHALGVNNFDSHLPLKPHGVAIVKKCDGLPLSLKAIGRLLSTKKDKEEYWKQVLDSEIWRLPVEDEIAPALKLSYHDLSESLKQLFAYCSLYPKNYVFDKVELVQLWSAEGFLHQLNPSNKTQECLGLEYFDELLLRSFFQHEPNNNSLFVMHDMISDLAISVAGEFFLRSEKDIRKEALEKYRHMSFVREKYVAYKKFEPLKGAKSLRTFMATSVGVVESSHRFYFSNNILVDLFLELPLLRVLCLSGFQISDVPESIGTLSHLRYLNLSRSGITHLPESVCNLYNLETLIVSDCQGLAKLPNNLLKLKNLRHLDIRDTWYLKETPIWIRELKNLQTLSKIFIGGESGFEITNLKDLKYLCGKISIAGLEKVQNAIHTHEANFSQKRFSELEVVWSDVLDGSQNEMLEKEVLNELKPRNEYLKQLKIISYGGPEFPNWVGDPSFLRLNYVSIRGCKNCTTLPPLGQLPALKELFIERLDGVKVVGMELLGSGLAFPSLENLSFESMTGWEKWSMNSEVVFPCLQKLIIRHCPKLVEVTLKALPSLNVLHIVECDSDVLRRLVQVASSIAKLEISSIPGLNDVLWRGVTEYLGGVEYLKISYCNEIRYLWESEAIASKVLVKLRKLEVSGCDNLLRLGEKEEKYNSRRNLLPSLRLLNVSHCKNAEHCNCPNNIETLSVICCDSITSISLPIEGQELKSLSINGCNELLEREWGGHKLSTNSRSVPMLDCLMISGWVNLKSIIKLNYLVHLTSLSIVTCANLESFPDNELSNLTSLMSLAILNCPSMDARFPRGVWPPNLRSLEIGQLKKPISEWGPQDFPTSLIELYLDGDDGVSSCSQLAHVLPSSLISLHMHEFEKLESFSIGLQHLTSLQHLYFDDCPELNKLSYPQHLTALQHLSFTNCPNMMDLPEALFPSLLSLHIDLCPDLKEKCCKSGCYWPLISHIPFIDLYP